MKHTLIFLAFFFSSNCLLCQQNNKFIFGVEGQLLEVRTSIRKNTVGVPVSEGSYSLRANIGYYFPKKRITLLSGVGYKSTNHIIRGSDLEVTYSEENAVSNPDGSLSISYEFPFYTAFGNVDINILLLANSNQRNFEEGDNVIMNISIKNNIRWILFFTICYGLLLILRRGLFLF